MTVIAWSLEGIEVPKTHAYDKQAMNLSRQLNWAKGIGLTLFAEGLIDAREGQLKESLADLTGSRKIFDSLADYEWKSNLMDKTAIVYHVFAAGHDQWTANHAEVFKAVEPR